MAAMNRPSRRAIQMEQIRLIALDIVDDLDDESSVGRVCRLSILKRILVKHFGESTTLSELKFLLDCLVFHLQKDYCVTVTDIN